MVVLKKAPATEVSPFSLADTAGLIEAVAGWSEALHGSAALDDAFACLVRGMGAEAGAIVRTYPGRPFPQIVTMHDEKAGDGVSRPLRGSFASALFGAYLESAMPATVWLASQHTDDTDTVADAGLLVWQSARRFREMAVLTLTSNPSFQDHIELHFRERLPESTVAMLNVILPSIARIWACRKVGLITAQVAERRRRDEGRPALTGRGPILGAGNPADLSRAEFRVSVLLSRGLSVKGVSTELGLSEATIRSHLRSIYAKTGTRSLAQLVFLLLERPAGPEEAAQRWA